MSIRSKFAALAAGAAAMALVLTGCGGGGGATGPAPAGEQKKEITIGMFPVVDASPGQAALLHGVFEKNGLKVTIKQTTGGSQAIPSLMAKEFDIAFSNYPSMILGAKQGLPLMIASGNNIGNADHTVMAPANSTIASAKDLEGKKVAVSHLKNIGVLAISNAVAEAGGDPAKVTYVELPFQDMQAALERGDVDAMWMIEPFMAKAKEGGHKIVVDNFSGDFKNIPVSGWVTTKEFAQQNPETVKAFQKSIDEAAKLISDDTTAMTDTVKAFTKVDPAVLGSMVLPTWSGEIDKPGLEKVSAAMSKYGFIEGTFDVGTIVPN